MASTHSLEIATECVESVKFSFLTTEEVRKHSFKKITEVLLFDNLDRPVPGGLYDPALGPVHKSQCQTCGLRSDVCPGHCGHIELVSPIYNPLLFSVLIALLRRMCFSCHSFTDEREYVERCAFQLHLILKGDMVRAKEVDMVLQDDWEKLNEEESSDDLKRAKRENLTSLQYSSAMALLDEFMKRKNNKCARCGFKGPKITQPTFGWIYMELANSTIRRNVIRGAKLDKPISDKTEGIDINLEGTPNSEKEANLPAEFLKQKKLLSGPLLPSEVKDHIQLLWENETQLCSLISDIHRERLCLSGKTRSYYMFFIDALLVPPIKFRPLTTGGDSVTNHPQTILLSKVLQSNIDLGNAINSDRSRAVSKWLDLQQSVNLLFGNKKSIGQRDNMASGICQVLEKKEGIFRQKMMGKRVNYSCRSVISPDPYIAVNEIGIPPCFALKLTYPERVTPWNVDKLRSAIINGPDELPGATHYSVHSVNNKLPPWSKKMRISIARKLPSSRGIITQLGKSLEHEQEGKVVYRHLRDGDIVLVNRQPTLHKPSIMAHVVRVLSGEKTIRMHYANCSTYNADFDGDEMNVHFPQDEISRAEGYQIVNANNQYIVPTSGDTKRGLIQDHIVSAVLLTKKDTFLSREEYTHLLYSSGVSAVARGSSVGKSCQKVFTSLSEDDIELTMPAIWKPEPLWTGKQVITSLLNHMTRSKGLPPFTFEGKCTLDNEFLTSQSTYNDPPKGKKSEHPAFQIHENEFLNGVIDKAQFGKYGLVHTVQELYGSNTAGMLLSGLSRLFTVFLQLHGFTCGIDDLLLKDVIDTKRREGLKKADKINEEVYLRFTNAEQENAGKDGEKISSQSVSLDRKDDNRDRMKLQKAIELKVRVHGDNAIKALDKTMTNAANELSNEISNIIFPRKTNDKSAKKSEDKPEDIGLSKSFPGNCFFLMTKSGAKGTQANFTQVSSLLGQQSLEGKRVPLMISGKTLPCFPPWDPALRAGGFITDCFLTGLRPQEYYFHCMAGREGLVDTAVKTSRSGYLQRCLVKNLECLKVTYDGTVRDADGSIIQFCYGEDGVDVHKTSFMSKFDTIACNHTVVRERLRGLQCKDAECLLGRTDNGGLRKKLKEKVNNVINTCVKKQHASDEVILEKNKKHLNFMQTKNVMDLMMLKYLSSLAEPGEPVGVIAAQSVGEPSTQMTLNTFHHAGQKVSNVTLGIPRLQEILMRASEKIQTPIMSCPLMKGKTKDDAEHLAGALRNVSLADIVESMEVSLVHRGEKHEFAKIYKLKMKLYDQKKIPESSGVQLVDCGEILTFKFVQELERAIKSHLAMLSKIAGIKNVVQETESDSSEGADEVDPGRSSEQKSEEHDVSDDDDDVAEDLDTDEQKRRRMDEMDYEDDMENENMDREPSEIHSENDQIELQAGNNTDDEAHASVADFESTVTPVSKPKLSSKKLKSEAVTKMASMLRNQKDDDRAVYVNFEGTHFEVHFRLNNNDPHILLSQIAQKAAKNVYVKKLAKVENCEVSKDTKNDEPPIIHILGSDFHALWDMQDEIDVKRIDSNDIHAILETYGVEAARATIVKELQNVFGTYGISTDFRHLSLIADFMTHSGQYRAMSRHTMADCISPFSKMSFETASTFIVDAAYHGDVDNLETPSARICLGMPVKMGTGSFDLMQKGILINGQFPGPDIYAVTNDNLVINVINNLPDPFLITWNGIQQKRNSWEDGVSGTNCPIPPGGNFTYNFQVKDQIGSFFYFPSLAFQKAAGGFGAIRIASRPLIPVPFPEPAEDYTVLIGDWYAYNHRDILDNGRIFAPPDGILINGLGSNCASFRVEKGKTYRFRISNVGLRSTLSFSIGGHQMKLVEVEGTHTIQSTYTWIEINVGQSCSVLVTADQPAEDYYILVAKSPRNAQRKNEHLYGVRFCDHLICLDIICNYFWLNNLSKVVTYVNSFKGAIVRFTRIMSWIIWLISSNSATVSQVPLLYYPTLPRQLLS